MCSKVSETEGKFLKSLKFGLEKFEIELKENIYKKVNEENEQWGVEF